MFCPAASKEEKVPPPETMDNPGRKVGAVEGREEVPTGAAKAGRTVDEQVGIQAYDIHGPAGCGRGNAHDNQP